MPSQRHSVRTETLQVTADSEALALALRPRLQELNRTAFLEAIERVFDECSTPDQHIHISSLQIDLGTIHAADFERVVVERLERELRDALRRVIPGADDLRRTSSNYVSRSSADARLEALAGPNARAYLECRLGK